MGISLDAPGDDPQPGVKVERPQRSEDDDLDAGEDRRRLRPTRGPRPQGMGITSSARTGWDRERARTRGALCLISVHGVGSGDVMVDGMAPLGRLRPLGL
jgi:hypothetical protein